jgi:hypothetical protein
MPNHLLVAVLGSFLIAASAVGGPRFNSGYQYGSRSEYVFTPEGTYTVTPQNTFSGGYRYTLPGVIVTDPCVNQRHGTRYSDGWVFGDSNPNKEKLWIKHE